MSSAFKRFSVFPAKTDRERLLGLFSVHTNTLQSRLCWICCYVKWFRCSWSVCLWWREVVVADLSQLVSACVQYQCISVTHSLVWIQCRWVSVSPSWAEQRMHVSDSDYTLAGIFPHNCRPATFNTFATGWWFSPPESHLLTVTAILLEWSSSYWHWFPL